MEIVRHETNERLSRVVEYGDTIYFCGHVGTGKTVTEQAKSLFARYDELFEKYGTDKQHMLSAAVYLSDISFKTEFDAVWAEWVDMGTAPTRHCVEARLGSPEYFAEVIITAAKK